MTWPSHSVPFQSAQVLIKQVTGSRNIARVPPFPIASLIASDKQDCFTCWAKAKRMRSSVRPDDPGRSSFIFRCLDEATVSTIGRPSWGPQSSSNSIASYLHVGLGLTELQPISTSQAGPDSHSSGQRRSDVSQATELRDIAAKYSLTWPEQYLALAETGRRSVTEKPLGPRFQSVAMCPRNASARGGR